MSPTSIKTGLAGRAIRRLGQIGVVAVVVAGGSTLMAAQRGARQGPANYNVATEVTLAGTVDQVIEIPAPGRGEGGVHLMLRTEAGLTEVHLGPRAFMTGKGFTFAKGDAISVTGSKVRMDDQDVVLAKEVRRGAESLTLRTAEGFPLWSGRGRR
jgi:hypothetical protein